MDDQVGVDEAGATALTQFCILAKSTKGPACTSVISQALDHPSIFVFAELLDIPTVQEVAFTPVPSTRPAIRAAPRCAAVGGHFVGALP